MNYIKLHQSFIQYFLKTSPKERLISRDKTDKRLLNGNDFIYTERHHITPRSLGGLDVDSNLIELLPEEHLFVHELRYKAFNKREDMLAVRFCINGYNNPSTGKPKNLSYVLNKSIRKGYAFIRNQSAEFRKEHGWQTKDGRNRISKSKIGTMPAVSSLTGESVGNVHINDPKVISGEYVHHSTGYLTVIDQDGKKTRITSIEYQKNKDKYTYFLSQSGEKNSRYSGITDDDIINEGVRLSLIAGEILPYRYILRKSKMNLPKSLSTMRFNGMKASGYIIEMKKKLPNMIYNRNYRDKDSVEKSRESANNFYRNKVNSERKKNEN